MYPFSKSFVKLSAFFKHFSKINKNQIICASLQRPNTEFFELVKKLDIALSDSLVFTSS